MAGGTTECQAGAGGLGGIELDPAMGRGGNQRLDDVLYGGGAGGATVWIRFLGTVGSNGENVGRGAHWFPVPKHEGPGVAEHGWYVGDTGGGVSAEKIRDIVDGHLHWT